MDPLIGTINMFAGNFAPRGWALCNGQLLSISQNTALFSVLGTTYGGDGRTTFALPDLRGRVPIGAGQGPGLDSFLLGEKGGTASSGTVTVNTTFESNPSTSEVQKKQENLKKKSPPFQGINFIIALEGIYPSRG